MKYLFVFLILILVILFSTSCKEKVDLSRKTEELQQTPDDSTSSDEIVIGSPCTYDTTEGKAKIISIGKEYIEGDIKRKEVLFQFSLKDFRDKETESFTFMVDGYDPTPEYISKEKIVEGKIFDCLKLEIKDGTCTPVSFEFK